MKSDVIAVILLILYVPTVGPKAPSPYLPHPSTNTYIMHIHAFTNTVLNKHEPAIRN